MEDVNNILLKGTSKKYSCIRGFLNIIYAADYRDHNPEYLNNILSITKNKQNFSTLAELINAYVKLMNTCR